MPNGIEHKKHFRRPLRCFVTRYFPISLNHELLRQAFASHDHIDQVNPGADILFQGKQHVVTGTVLLAAWQHRLESR